MQRLAYLDGIRGILALEVALCHIYGSAYGWDWKSGFGNTYIAVDCFFIMSGFVLTYASGAAIQRGQIGYGRYFYMRAARLTPVHVAALAAYFVVTLVNSGLGRWTTPENIFELSRVLKNIFLVQGVAPNAQISINDPSWSTSIELFVSGILLVFFLRKRIYFSLAISALAFALLYIFHGPLLNICGSFVPGINGGMARGIAGILLGSALFRMSQSGGRASWIADSGALACAALVFSYAAMSGGGYDFAIVGVFCVLCALLWSGRAPATAAVLSLTPLRFLGKISYSLYLIHTPVVILILPSEFGFGKASAVLVTVAVSILAATALHYWIELPAHGLLRRPARRTAGRFASEPSPQQTCA